MKKSQKIFKKLFKRNLKSYFISFYFRDEKTFSFIAMDGYSFKDAFNKAIKISKKRNDIEKFEIKEQEEYRNYNNLQRNWNLNNKFICDFHEKYLNK